MHVNCHAHVGEQYYFPAEIAVLEFNLLNGVSRTFHRIIGICKYKYMKIINNCSLLDTILEYNKNELELLIKICRPCAFWLFTSLQKM